MKKLKSFSIFVLMLFSVAISAQQAKKINVKESSIEWVGKKVTGQHNGTIEFAEGNIIFKGDKVSGGKFIVDMNTINTTDLQGEWKGKLDGHLKSDDFFGVTNHPQAILVFKTVQDKGNGVTTVNADLTIKGKTNPITFDIKTEGNSATAKLNVDRTKYDIKYGSGSFFDNLGDKAIHDEFELTIKLVF